MIDIEYVEMGRIILSQKQNSLRAIAHIVVPVTADERPIKYVTLCNREAYKNSTRSLGRAEFHYRTRLDQIECKKCLKLHAEGKM